MKVLVLGAKGTLGQDLVRVFGAFDADVEASDLEELDVTDVGAVRKTILGNGYDLIINAVAINDVDGAEDPTKQDIVWAVNAEAPGTIAAAAKEAGATFVHYSTDYVFDGTKEEGYTEDDEPHPISFYGESKLGGEEAVREAGGRSFVCRVSKLYGRPGVSEQSKPSFVDTMVRLAQVHPSLTIVDEEVGMPTYTYDIAEATLALIGWDYEPGIYHLVNDGPGVTWYGFAEEFFAILGITTPRTPVPSSAFPKPAPRPLYGMLRNTKFTTLRAREEALKAYFKECPVKRIA